MTRRWIVHTDPTRRWDDLRAALHSLKDAQELIRMAQAPYVLLKVHSARRSLEGAIRHAEGRVTRHDHTRTVTKARRPRLIACQDRIYQDPCHPKEGSYTCRLPIDHPGDHIDTRHPMHPSWTRGKP